MPATISKTSRASSRRRSKPGAAPKPFFVRSTESTAGDMMPTSLHLSEAKARAYGFGSSNETATIHAAAFTPMKSERRFVTFRANLDRQPTSLVDAAAPGGVGEWYDAEGDEMLTRAEALEAQADANREPSDRLYDNWIAIAEVGQPLNFALVTANVERGFGILTRIHDYPLRIVEPTAAEQARFPIPADWKGVRVSPVSFDSLALPANAKVGAV